MTNDADWVEDVKRWYLAGARSALPADAAVVESESSFIGYEAAHPALQARNWPEAQGFSDSV